MYFDLDDDQRAFVATVREFAANEIAPGAAERDRGNVWFAEGWRKMGALGLLGLQFPEDYGGSGADVVTTAAAFQAFTAGGADAGIALSWIAHSVLAGTPLWLFGSPSQKDRYLRAIATGQQTAGYGLTEPAAGSDAASLQTTAVRKGDCWVLNGSKMFITNAPIGDFFVVFASIDRARGSKGITAFIVERGFPGFSSGRELDKMGNRTSPTGELIFQDCEVPARNLLGEPGQGFAIAKAALEWERFLMMAHSVGTMEAILADSLRYARDRQQFGKPIAEQPAIQAKLADMWINVAAGESFVRRVAWLKDQGRDTPLESSSCKVFNSGAVMSTALQGVQVHGGYGYVREFAVERNMRDAKLAEIGGGTSEIQRQVVGRAVLAAADQRWDAAYTPAQLADRTKPATDARDLVSAVLALAEQARVDHVEALASLPATTLHWAHCPQPFPTAVGGGAYDVGAPVLNAIGAQWLLADGKVHRKPDGWAADPIEHALTPSLDLGTVRITGEGEAFDAGRLPAVAKLFGAAVATGMAESALDEALASAREQAEGEPDQLSEFKLADMRTRLDGARMLVHQAAIALQTSGDPLPACRVARVFAVETAMFCIDGAAALAIGLGSARLQTLVRDCHLPAVLDAPLAEERLAIAGDLLSR